jgi:hypothetical protein
LLYSLAYTLFLHALGSLPSSLCRVSSLKNGYIKIQGNPSMSCYADCFSQFPLYTNGLSNCKEIQSKALCAFRSATNMASLHPEWSCSPNANPCLGDKWYGVECSNGYISALNISDAALQGECSIVIAWRLRVIEYNFIGAMTASIGLLSALGTLTRLEIQHAHFTGKQCRCIMFYSS